MRTEKVEPAADRRTALVPSRGREERPSDDTARGAEELPTGPGLAKENDPQKATERGARRDERDDDARRPEREGRQIPDRGGRGGDERHRDDELAAAEEAAGVERFISGVHRAEHRLLQRVADQPY